MERPFDVSADLYPFEDHWFERDGTAMHYVDHGDGPPVVMVHGNPTWSFLYRDIIKALGTGVRCLAPDYPGFGMSQHPPGYGYTPPEHAEWIGAWLDHLKLDPFVLVVQDWGGPIGLSVAVQRPEQIAGLVVMNTWAWRPTALFKVFSWVIGGPLGPFMHQRLNLFAKRMLPFYMTSKKAPEVYEAYTKPFPDYASRRGTYVFPRALRQHDDWLASLWNDMAKLTEKPVELVWGDKDPSFGDAPFVAKWRRKFPDAEVTHCVDASHFVQEDAPGPVAAAIQRLTAARSELE